MEYFKICEGVPVRINDSGKGEFTVVLLHGYLETSNVWEDFAKLLSPKFRVMSVDLPGHGLSGSMSVNSMEFMADVVASAMDACGIVDATIVGHSMGGYVALAFAKKYNARTNRLCLFHSHPKPDSDEKKELRKREIALVKSGKFETILKASISGVFANINLKRMDDKLNEMIEDVAISEPDGIIACIQGMNERADMTDFLLAFDKPAMFIFGAYDNYMSVETRAELQGQFDRCKHVLLERSGHIGFVEEPALSAQTIIDFMG